MNERKNEVTKFENYIGMFRSKSFVLVVLIEAKGHCRKIFCKEGFVCTAILTIALRWYVKIQLIP